MENNIVLSVIMPSYCEEENLRIILPRIHEELQKLDVCYELLIIDTMQPIDNTKIVCEQNNSIYINRDLGNTYGDAIRTGIKRARGTYIIFMDADGSHSPEFIKKLYEHKDNYDVVIASRYIKGGGSDNKKILIFMSLIVNLIYSIVLNLQCKDVSNSFKLYKANALKKINLYCNNFDIVEEILFKLKKKNKKIKIKEIPFLFKERMFGHTKRNLFIFILSYFISIIKLRLRK